MTAGEKQVIAIGCDHGGLDLKLVVKAHLLKRGYELLDLGTDSEDSVNYPDFGRLVGEAVANGDAEKGIVICGTGIGISIAANKVNGIRAALVYDENTAVLAKEHNNANVLAMGGRTTDPDLACRMVDLWLDTEFGGGRHQKRIDLIHAIEKK